MYMPNIRIIPHSLPTSLLESDPTLSNTLEETKVIKLSRVPKLGESIIWHGMNFRITKITYIYNYDYDAVAEIQWCEKLPPESHV